MKCVWFLVLVWAAIELTAGDWARSEPCAGGRPVAAARSRFCHRCRGAGDVDVLEDAAVLGASASPTAATCLTYLMMTTVRMKMMMMMTTRLVTMGWVGQSVHFFYFTIKVSQNDFVKSVRMKMMMVGVISSATQNKRLVATLLCNKRVNNV